MKMAHVDGGLYAGRRLIEVSFWLGVSCHAKEGFGARKYWEAVRSSEASKAN